MITITLEGESWQDILDEMTIIQNAARASRIDAKPEDANIAKDCPTAHDEPKKPVCAYCRVGLGLGSTIDSLGRAFCSAACADMSRHDPYRLGLGPEERVEIMERVR